MLNGSMTYSVYGGLVQGSTADLVRKYAYYGQQVGEIDGRDGFADAYAYECSANDRADYRKRMRDLSTEINIRLQCEAAWNEQARINERLAARRAAERAASRVAA